MTTNADRKYRNQRTTALTCGVMAEVLLGGTLLVWSTSPSAAESAVFGPGGSIAVVATAMVLLAIAMLVIVLAPRLGRKVLMATVAAVSLASACVGVIAITTLLTDPGLGFLLGWGWVLTIPVTLAITRAPDRSRVLRRRGIEACHPAPRSGTDQVRLPALDHPGHREDGDQWLEHP